MPDLPTPITPDDPAELPVEPDRGPATPAAPPSDSTVPPPAKPDHGQALRELHRVTLSRHFMRAATFRWRMV